MGQTSLLGQATRPDSSGNCVRSNMQLVATNKRWPHEIWKFRNTGSVPVSLFGTFDVPPEYPGSPTIARVFLDWSATVTSGDVRWGIDIRAVGGDNVESLDQTGQQENDEVTDTAPGAIWRKMRATLDLTPANFAAGDLVQFELYRDLSDAADTLSGDVYLFRALFDYA